MREGDDRTPNWTEPLGGESIGVVEGGEEAPDNGGEGKTVVVVVAVGLADGEGVT